MKRRISRIFLLAIAIACGASSYGQCGEYKNAWVKYADDKLTAYSIDTNSVMRNDSGNYYVLIMMTPYRDNVFNKKLNRSDIVYVYSEAEIDIIRNRIRTLSFRAFDKRGREVLTDTYEHTGEVPPFMDVVEGSVTHSLLKFVVNHFKAKGQ